MTPTTPNCMWVGDNRRTAEPKWHGIVFQSPMVQAIQSGGKTQTRRLATLSDNDRRCPQCRRLANQADIYTDPHGFGGPTPIFKVPCRKCEITKRVWPRWCQGDMLWVREVWRPMFNGYAYRANWADDRIGKCSIDDPTCRGGELCFHDGRWRSSRFMPRKASRISLRIERIRLEHVHEISTLDVLAEGLASADVLDAYDLTVAFDRLNAFRTLWNRIHPKPHERWEAETLIQKSPLVWVLDFVRVAP